MNKLVSLTSALGVFLGFSLAHATVAVFNKDTGTKCAGILIGKRSVLTAPQCVDSKSAVVIFGNETRKVVKVAYSPQYNATRILKQDGKNMGLLAILFLDSEAPAGVKLTLLGQTYTKIADGEGVTVTGFSPDKGSALYQSPLNILDSKYSLTEFSVINKDSKSFGPGEAGSPVFKAEGSQQLAVGIVGFRTGMKAVVTKIAPYRDWMNGNLK